MQNTKCKIPNAKLCGDKSDFKFNYRIDYHLFLLVQITYY